MARFDEKTEDERLKDFEEFEKSIDTSMGHGAQDFDDDPAPDPDPVEAGDELDAGAVQEDPPTPDEPAPDPEPTPDPDPDAVATADGDEPDTLTLPDDDFYGELRGQKVTTQQLQEAGLLSKLLTRDHQVSHYQKLYEDSKTATDELNSRLEALEKPAEPDPDQATEPEVTTEQLMEELENNFTPVLKNLADRGLIEQDWAAVYPKKALLDAYYVDLMLTGFGEMTKRLDKMEGRVGDWSETEDTQKAAVTVGTIMRDMVAEDKALYGALEDTNVQNDYFKFLADSERNPFMFEPEDATPEKMQAAFLIYMAQAGELPATPPAADDPKPGQRRMTGTGGGSGGRGEETPAAAGEKSKFEEFEDAIGEAQREQFAG